MDDLKVICERIKDLRTFSDYSLEEFASKLKIPTTEYKEYENGEKDIPIGLLYNIASALEIDPSFILFGKNANEERVTMVTKGNGKEINRYEGYSFASLNANFVNRSFEPMLVTIKSGVKPELVQHKGQEFNYALKGALRVIVGEKEYYLHEGDSIYFDATLPHAQVAMNDIAEFITVIEK